MKVFKNTENGVLEETIEVLKINETDIISPQKETPEEFAKRNCPKTKEFYIDVKIKTIMWSNGITTIFTGEYVGSKEILKEMPDDVSSDKSRIVLIADGYSPKKNDQITLRGYFEKNKTGRYAGEYSFKVSEVINGYSKEDNMFYSFLSSGIIDGINSTTARLIIEKYGTKNTSVFKDMKKLIAIKGIGEISAEKIIKSFDENYVFFELYVLTGGIVTKKMLKKIEKVLGSDAAKKVKADPYLLIYLLNGVGFKKADTLAFSIGFKDVSKERFLAGIVFALKDAADNLGHTFMYKEELKKYVAELIFPHTYMKDIYYKEILGQTVVPFDTSNFDNLAISKYSKKVMETIFTEWNVYDEKREAYNYERLTKLHKFTEDEVTLVNIVIKKRKAFYDMYDAVLEEQEKLGRIVIHLEDRIYERANYEREKFISGAIISLLKNKEVLTSKYNIKFASKEDVLEAIMEYELSEGRQLGEEQIKGILKGAMNPFSIITGGPGRGKTAIMIVIIKALIKAGNPCNIINLLAPTGRASARMTESTNFPAITIHRKFMDPCNYEEGQIYFCDETSMVNLELMCKIMRFSKGCMFIFVGDIDQLPSIGAGSILRDMINSGVIPFTRLITCYRNEGSIIENVNMINSGGGFEDFTLDNHTKYEYFNDDNDVLEEKVLKTYLNSLKKYDAKDIGVVVCKRKMGTSSSRYLNKYLQNKINPIPQKESIDNYELKVYLGKETEEDTGFAIFRKNDRVIHLKNNYQMDAKFPVYEEGVVIKYDDIKGCFNGETGTIISIDNNSKELTVEFDDGKIANYLESDLRELELAYAITTHKCQGSEYKVAIVVNTKSDFVMLERNLLYTAASRAKELLIFLGSAKYFNIAIKKVSSKDRNSGLKDMLITFDETMKDVKDFEWLENGFYYLYTLENCSTESIEDEE